MDLHSLARDLMLSDADVASDIYRVRTGKADEAGIRRLVLMTSPPHLAERYAAAVVEAARGGR